MTPALWGTRDEGVKTKMREGTYRDLFSCFSKPPSLQKIGHVVCEWPLCAVSTT